MRGDLTPGHDGMSRTFTRRTTLILGLQAAIVGALGWRMHDLGVRKSTVYAALAEENRISIRLIPPTRGVIHDRRGVVLARNETLYKVDIVRERTIDFEAVLSRLSSLIPIDPEDLDRTREEVAKHRAFIPVTVATRLTWDEISRVAANAPALPGIIPGIGWERRYPLGESVAHVVGYVGPVSDYDLERIDDKDPLLLIPRYQIGKTGVENKLEKTLRGTAGIRRIEVNSVGRIVRELDRTRSRAGTDLQLTLDGRFQAICLDLLEGLSASAVVMDTRTGDILAMASAPSFDPEKFVTGISVADWKALNENDLRPLLNKPVSGTYPPGSTFKMIVALAALEAGVIAPGDRVRCSGFTEVSGRRFFCWQEHGHGPVTMQTAIQRSCDVYFYEIAKRTGIARINTMARRFGLGTRHDLPLRAVHAGLVPTQEWKRDNRARGWVVGDTLNVGIGQGFLLASPMQLAVMAARIASGKAVQPNLVFAQADRFRRAVEFPALDIDPSHLELVRDGMFDVVNHPRGTAYGSRVSRKSRQFAGKTGTSQVRAITSEERETGVISNEELPRHHRDHALFVAYAPFSSPAIAVSIVAEHAGSGSRIAAPIARDILLAAFDLGLTDDGPRDLQHSPSNRDLSGLG